MARYPTIFTECYRGIAYPQREAEWLEFEKERRAMELEDATDAAYNDDETFGEAIVFCAQDDPQRIAELMRKLFNAAGDSLPDARDDLRDWVLPYLTDKVERGV